MGKNRSSALTCLNRCLDSIPLLITSPLSCSPGLGLSFFWISQYSFFNNSLVWVQRCQSIPNKARSVELTEQSSTPKGLVWIINVRNYEVPIGLIWLHPTAHQGCVYHGQVGQLDPQSDFFQIWPAKWSVFRCSVMALVNTVYELFQVLEWSLSVCSPEWIATKPTVQVDNDGCFLFYGIDYIQLGK